MKDVNINKVLVIDGSMIKQEKSYSHALKTLYVNYYQEYHPQDEIEYLDLNQTKIATITLTRNNFETFFNYDDSDYYIEQLKRVNKVVIVSPMTNFNVTSMIKNYLDHILVAGKTFSYKYLAKGKALGLLPHLKVQILVTQGAPKGWYPWGNHDEYLKGTWEFVGAQVVDPIVVAGTKTKPYSDMSPSSVVNTFKAQIAKAAKLF